MVNRDYIKEIGLPSHTPVLSRLPTFALLAAIFAGASVTVVHVATTAPVHAPKAVVASAQR